MSSISGLALLVVGALLGGFGLYRLGGLIGGKKMPWVGPLFVFAGALVTPWLLAGLLDRTGVVEKVVVADRRESVSVGINGAPRWERWISVKEATGTGGLRRIRVDQAGYDEVAFGDPVEIRYLPIWKSLVRLERSRSMAWLAIQPLFRRSVAVMAGGAVLIGLLIFGGKGTTGAARRIVGAGLIGLGGYGLVDQLGPFAGQHPLEGAVERRQGTVQRMWRVASLYPASPDPSRIFKLERPYRLVAIEYTPTARRGALLVVDAVDDASVTNLAVGDAVTIRYQQRDPRQARLEGGSRRFIEDNANDRRRAGIAMLGVLAGLLALRALLGGRR